MTHQITLQLSDDSADNEELYDLTHRLLRELNDSDAVEDATQARGGTMLEGAKSGADPVTIGQLLLVVLPTTLPALIVLLQNWLLRQKNDNIKIKIGDDAIEIPRDMTPEDAQKYVNLLKDATSSQNSTP